MALTVNCVARGNGDLEESFEYVDDNLVQFLLLKFPIGSGTYKRTKYIYVHTVGPKCGIVKRGKYMGESANVLKRLGTKLGFESGDGASVLSFDYLVTKMSRAFVSDDGTFDLELVKQSYLEGMAEEIEAPEALACSPSRAVSVASFGREPSMATGPNGTQGGMMSPANPVGAVEIEGLEGMEENPPPMPPPEGPDSTVGSPSPTRGSNPRLASGMKGVDIDLVLKAIGDEYGPFNWITFTPKDEKKLASGAIVDVPDRASDVFTMQEGGSGGLFEFMEDLEKDSFLYGIVRISVGKGRFRRSKRIFFTWAGEEVNPLQKMKKLQCRSNVRSLLMACNGATELHGSDDLDIEKVLQSVEKFFVIDNIAMAGKEKPKNKLTAEEYIETLAEEKKQAEKFFEKAASQPNNNLLQQMSIHMGGQEDNQDASASHVEEEAPPPLMPEELSPGMPPASPPSAPAAGKGSRILGDFNVDETIRLIHSDKGGLSWSVFQFAEQRRSSEF